ncbi:glucuronyl esterase domain-containing protein [Fulvivirga ligni]|uniref:glucuronyl esterase domain-containing protein n=1 Tax=Fulvivirga ligni TaxID=2904246 RepID=UPI001F2CA726|nr:RICIN domain-containing protein [Fulvivirga ligni]UII23317.1 RICIN domain-containing protein [Fulvivirga ligni]
MKIKSIILFKLAFFWLIINSLAQSIPISYNVENRWQSCSVSAGSLSNNPNFPDPFSFTSGGRVSSLDDWICRRNEIKADLEAYEIGQKPNKPANVTASYSGNTLTVTVSENGRSLTLTSQFSIPSGGGPHPIVIGMNSGTGSLSSSLFNGIVQVPFNHNQVATYSFSGKDTGAPFYRFYPNLTYVGDYAAWSWGVSRLIDGLEIVAPQLNLDMSRIAVTGCSYAGKMALFSGALDERIALTIAQESGGGGINSWRASQDFVNRTGINVEKIDNTNGSWFMSSMLSRNPYSLPHDHHELIAMIAPRAFLTLGNENYGDWLGDESGYKSTMAALEVWKAMGVEDRFGFNFTGGHQHCQAASSQNSAVTAFVNKFLRNNTSTNTTIRVQPTRSDFNYNWQSYVNWTTPNLSGGNGGGGGNASEIWLEAECGSTGSLWNTSSSESASNGQFVTIQPGNNSTSSAPSSSNGHITYNFNVSTAGNYNLWGRVITPTANDDSFWVRIDNGSWQSWNNIAPGATSWTWDSFSSYNLSSGNHTLTIAYREDGAQLDKLYLTTSGSPSGTGSAAGNCSGGGGSTGSIYQIRNRATGMYLDGLGSTTNGDPAVQWASTSHPNSQWQFISTGDGYNQLRNVGAGLYLDGMGTTTNGADVAQWANTSHPNSHWIAQQYSGSYYRIQNRATGLYLDGMGRNTNGAACGQYANTTNQNAQWQLISVSSSSSARHSPAENDLNIYEQNALIYPNPVQSFLHIKLPEGRSAQEVSIYNTSGKRVLQETFSGEDQKIDVSNLKKGHYILEFITPNGTINSKFVKE